MYYIGKVFFLENSFQGEIEMKRSAVLTLVLGMFAMSGCATTGAIHDDGEKPHAPMTKHYEDTLFQTTEKGEFSVEVLLPDEGIEMGFNKIDVIIHDKKDHDITGADILVTPWMPSMDHGVKEKPVISERGGGLYAVSNLVFSMTGQWEIRVKVVKGDIVDSAAITLPEIGAMGHTKSMDAPAHSDIDTATHKESRNGRFKASFTSDADPIPVNKLHTWTLNLSTPDGDPITGAKITLLGDMPEHGHGFPTEPEVSAGMENGQYLVEGLKFSMPGWWVVTFHVMIDGEMDRVAFNLILK
jgi:hypothetical protein